MKYIRKGIIIRAEAGAEYIADDYLRGKYAADEVRAAANDALTDGWVDPDSATCSVWVGGKLID